MKSAPLPAIFFGHGSPMNSLESNRYTDTWRRLGASLPRPRAILCVSAHWTVPGTAVTAMAAPRTIHDFQGFPRALFDVRYPAPGDPALAARVRDLLAPATVRLDQSRGLDHGAWSVLAHAFPGADVPVVQLALDATQGAPFHYALGQRLARLRDEGVLVAGSGNVVHNLGRMDWRDGAAPYEWARRFNDTIGAAILARDHDRVVAYGALGDDARQSVPTPEHFLPLLYVLGTQRDGEPAAIAADGIELASIGMMTVVVGELPAARA